LIKTALIIKGNHSAELFRVLQQCDEIELVGVACPDGKIDWLTEKEKKNYFVTADLDKIVALPELETVLDATGEPKIREYLAGKLVNGIKLECLTPHSLLGAIINSREQLLETRLLQGELRAILSAVQDAIEVVNDRGIIKYVNPAFTRVTGIPESKRLGRSIFKVSPHGALAQSLIHRQL